MSKEIDYLQRAIDCLTDKIADNSRDFRGYKHTKQYRENIRTILYLQSLLAIEQKKERGE